MVADLVPVAEQGQAAVWGIAAGLALPVQPVVPAETMADQVMMVALVATAARAETTVVQAATMAAPVVAVVVKVVTSANLTGGIKQAVEAMEIMVTTAVNTAIRVTNRAVIPVVDTAHHRTVTAEMVAGEPPRLVTIATVREGFRAADSATHSRANPFRLCATVGTTDTAMVVMVALAVQVVQVVHPTTPIQIPTRARTQIQLQTPTPTLALTTTRTEIAT